MAQVATSRGGIEPSKRDRLRQIIADRCYAKGRFTLASGKESDYYFNLKPAMLDAEGLNLIADLILERVADLDVDCIGGLAMGAVPIAIATITKSYETPRPLQAFWVRKEAKDHGTKNLADGTISRTSPHRRGRHDDRRFRHAGDHGRPAAQLRDRRCHDGR